MARAPAIREVIHDPSTCARESLIRFILRGKTMAGLPPVDALAYAGIAFVGAFGLWKTQLAPRLARLRASRDELAA
jgi:hypothetical protein